MTPRPIILILLLLANYGALHGGVKTVDMKQAKRKAPALAHLLGVAGRGNLTVKRPLAKF